MAAGERVARSLPVEQNAARRDTPRMGDEAHDGEGEDGFAAAGLADDAEGLAFFEGQVDAVDGGDLALLGFEGGAEGLDGEEVGHGRVLGGGTGVGKVGPRLFRVARRIYPVKPP